MFRIDPLSRQPVYEQLIDQLEKLVLLDLLPADSQLPSVRSLSLELTINPNTIQKAYSELDTRGIIYSVPGIGCFVSGNAKKLLLEYKRKKLTSLRALAAELALAGVSKEELLRCIEDAYTERGVTHDKSAKSDQTV
jgi:GntR family transcriptional regulator